MVQIQDKVLKRLYTDLFDQPVMGNTVRGFYVEALVAELLGPDWSLVSQDWAGWDLQHAGGCKGEVKQSAAVQTWDLQSDRTEKKIRPSFDIRPRSGHWVADKWIEKPGRMADLYFFCWHGVTDHKEVDQRDPHQWSFLVVPSKELPPNQKTISLSVLEKSWPAVSAKQLKKAASALATAQSQQQAADLDH